MVQVTASQAVTILTFLLGDEKKALITMLGKLYITPNSDGEKLQTALDLTAEAIDIKVATDATSRTALNRLHTALVKAVGDSAVNRKSVEEETMAQEGLTVVEENAVPEPSQMGDESKIGNAKYEAVTEAGDTLLEELLDDEEEL